MKKLRTHLLFLTMILLCSSSFAQEDKFTLYDQLVALNSYWQDHPNVDPALAGDPIIGSDVDIIQTHLNLVHQTLSEVCTDQLTQNQLHKRMKALDDLKAYANAREFPKNKWFAQRTPIFIDDEGTACAVGQLIIDSDNENLARGIANLNNDAYLRDMPAFQYTAWAVEHGFTFDELAWIQPNYGGGAFGCTWAAPGQVIPPSCPGTCDGVIGPPPNPTWGVPPYTYTGTPMGADFCALCAGTYTQTVTDAMGQSMTYSYDFFDNPWNTISTKRDPSCMGLCDGEMVVFATGGTPPYTYQWNPPVSNSDTASNLCSGVYTCTIIDANGCTVDVTDTIVDPNALPATTITQDTTIMQGDSVTICVTASDLTPFSFLWSTGETTPCITVSPDSSTSYSVVITDICGGTETLDMDVTVQSLPDGIAPHEVISHFELFPNPTNGLVNLSFSTLRGKNIPLTITDPSGRLVYQETLPATSGKQLFELDMKARGLTNGLYFITIGDGLYQHTRRLLLQR